MEGSTKGSKKTKNEDMSVQIADASKRQAWHIVNLYPRVYIIKLTKKTTFGGTSLRRWKLTLSSRLCPQWTKQKIPPELGQPTRMY